MENKTDRPEAEAGNEFAREAEAGETGMLSELWYYFCHSKKWWLTPIVIMLLLAGVLVLLSSTAAAPLIYTLF